MFLLLSLGCTISPTLKDDLEVVFCPMGLEMDGYSEPLAALLRSRRTVDVFSLGMRESLAIFTEGISPRHRRRADQNS